VALEAEASAQFPFPMFINSDPPNHTRLRNLFAPMMTPEALQPLEEYVRRKTVALIEPHMAAGRFDFVADMGCYLPMDVVSFMIGVPAEDQDKVRGWADDLIAREDKQVNLAERNISGYTNLVQYFTVHAQQHAAAPYTNNLLGVMMRGQAEGLLTREQVIGNMVLLAIAGNETTTKLIGNVAYRLWEHPEQRRWLAQDPTLIPKAIEETLRFDGSSQIIVRRVGKDIELHGKQLKKGDRVGLCIISANRDPSKYENPDVYDIRRGARDHMAFGFGIHSCLGAALARLETRVVFEEVLKRIPEYEIETAGLKRAHNPNVRGFTHVPSHFEPVGGKK
jgi:cytochrome P450